ncbi:MAG: hypothetical protein ACWGNK_00645 [Desulfobacterales bacterium]
MDRVQFCAQAMCLEEAAAIMGELTSDHLVDMLGLMDEGASRAILAQMDRKA